MIPDAARAALLAYGFEAISNCSPNFPGIVANGSLPMLSSVLGTSPPRLRDWHPRVVQRCTDFEELLAAGRVLADATVVLRDGRIASVGAAPAPAGVRTLDLGGKHLLPGLIESRSTAWNSAVVVE